MKTPWLTIFEYEAYAFIALLVTALATPVAARLAFRYGVLDRPDRFLKPHAKPTPYLGGTAICLGWSLCLLAAMFFSPSTVDFKLLLPIMLGGIVMSALGLCDDIFDISPRIRLAVGASVIFLVMASTGAGLHLARTPFGFLGISLPPAVALPISFLIGLFIVLGACNSTNLIDGLDGLCAGVTAIIALGFFIIAAYLAVYEWARDANATRLVLSIAMLGATLGFLPFNFNPAKIFMGDAGSVLLGYNCGIMILLFDEGGVIRWMLAGLMVFAVPILDTALAIFRRWRSGRSIFAGDRSHFYDQLRDRGWSVKQTVMICYALAIFFAILGCLAIWIRMRFMIVLYALVFIVIVFVIYRAGMTKAESIPPSNESPPTPDARPVSDHVLDRK